jgi:eukaryotic-like serine/threonine-protein kinase
MTVAWEGERVAVPSAEIGMEQIGEYIVRRLVGEGGMGRVYEAEERLSKRRVALKVLREELARSEHARGLFLNEMQILAHLEHPNIVRSLASIEADGKLVMVLEFLEGRTLREIAAEAPPSWEEAARIAVAVARALSAAHRQEPPVIHRDLKPENIMVLDGGGVKVMDFGIAKLVQELNQTNTQSVGTLQYMSPEQIDANPVDARTDLYCLGLVLYELLAGRPPFSSSSPRQLLNMQCSDAPPPFDERVRCPKGVQKLVFQLLEKRPDDRPASADEVVEALEDFLPEGGVSARAVSSPRAARPSTQQDTLPSASDEPTGDSPPKSPARRAAAASERKDTVALIEAASGPRELPLAMSIAIIAVVMAISAAATYAWRASQAPEPAGSPSRGWAEIE